jgi:hypothetical protein
MKYNRIDIKWWLVSTSFKIYLDIFAYLYITGVDPGFQIKGGGRTSKNCAEWREARKCLGYFMWKITILRQIIIFVSNFRGGEGRPCITFTISYYNTISLKSTFFYTFIHMYISNDSNVILKYFHFVFTCHFLLARIWMYWYALKCWLFGQGCEEEEKIILSPKNIARNHGYFCSCIFISQIASCMTSANKRWTIFGDADQWTLMKTRIYFF